MTGPYRRSGCASAQELIERVQADQVSLLRFAYCDLAGITRCKAIHVSQLPDRLVSGVGLTRAQMALNVLDELIDIEGMVPVGETGPPGDVLPRAGFPVSSGCLLAGAPARTVLDEEVPGRGGVLPA